MSVAILAVETLDCAHKLRVHYVLPDPLAQALCARFPDADVRVDAFSQLVQGAKDHLRFGRKHAFEAAGVLGETRLVVTYGKPLAARPTETVEAVEAALSAQYRAPIQRLQPKSDTP